MGEAINLVNNFKVEKVIFNCGAYNDLEKELIKVLDKKKIPYYSCIKELNIYDNKLYFLNNNDYGNENDNSSVIYTKLSNHKFLFMGDAGVEVEEDLIEKYDLQNIDVLKVGHHGSKTSSSKEFINEIYPKYSIISVGKNNRYGHPNKEVLESLKDSKIYRTDEDGSIMFKIKNNEYRRLTLETKNKLAVEDKIDVKDLVPNPILIKNRNNIEIFTEKALHQLIFEDIESFMKELGNLFSFIGSEYKIKIGDRYHFIDLLLFNIKYNCYVVVELKVTEFKVEYISQVQKYMNYIDKNIKEISNNDTIGILVCKRENKFVIEYCSDDRIIAREYELVCYNEYGVGKMKIELDNFIIEYDKEISYMPNIISTLENNTIEILEFFKLEKLSKKKRVVIYTDREKYRKHLLPFVKEFKEWMCADTYDGNINLLEISESRKSKEHEDMDLDEFVKCILHEFVHSCQQEWNANSNGTSWYWEALATNLSGQDYSSVSLDDCDFEKLKRDFNGTQNGYSYSYTLGKYMLENYSEDKLLEYVKNPDLLKKDADDIFQTVKQSQINKKL